MVDLLEPCDQLPAHIRTICRGEDPTIPLHDVNLNRAYGFGGLVSSIPPLGALSDSNPQVVNVPKLPPFVIRGWNFANALARWALAGMPRRTQEEIDVRLAICQSCPALQNDHCTKCGCACVESNQLINKLSLATEKCPDGKWS